MKCFNHESKLIHGIDCENNDKSIVDSDQPNQPEPDECMDVDGSNNEEQKEIPQSVPKRKTVKRVLKEIQKEQDQVCH